VKARVVDNGLRCLVPPCYSWNLIGPDGRVIDKVASIVSQAGARMETLEGSDVWEGDVEDYIVEDGPNAGTRAKRFIAKRTADW
jgi:hypothetical protein